MRTERLIDEVCQRVWFAGREQALRAVHATLEVLGERLHPIDAEVVRARLPDGLASSLRCSEDVPTFGRDELFERVREREGMRLSVTAEHVVVICQSLALLLDESARKHLRLRLPQELAELFEPPPARSRSAGPELRHYARSVSVDGRTLATGRQVLGVHASEPHGQLGSVVEADNPHSDTKISSAALDRPARPVTEPM